MFKKIVENYIDKITLNDVYTFAYSNNIILSNEECTLIYYTIKEHYQTLLYGDGLSIIKSLNMDQDKIKKMEELYFHFKNKYKYYL